ncbi:MAG: hypothetical protein O2960_27290, partial [Verrucomicrobia bacterium]|nr:hypothetical protein [Verrucomicrobiota bacterium]
FQTTWFHVKSGNCAGSVAALQDLAEDLANPRVSLRFIVIDRRTIFSDDTDTKEQFLEYLGFVRSLFLSFF